MLQCKFMTGLSPYPAMKDSGVECLGEVPEHWEVQKLRRTLRAVAARNRSDLPLLSVVREKGVVLRDVSNKDENHNFIPDDLTNYKVVQHGQFAMNKMKAWQGSYGVSEFDGIVSPAYFVFDLDSVDGNYFHTAIRSKAYVPYFTQASDGVRIGQWDLSQARMREIPFLVPPLTEQAAIVRFLDHADRRIRRYIGAKQKLIGLLEEQKQAIINQAVTGQIDVLTGQPYQPYKDSGVEWLGNVPEHWEVSRVKVEFHCLDRRRVPLSGTERGVMTLRRYDYYGASGVIDKVDNYLFDDEAAPHRGGRRKPRTAQFTVSYHRPWQVLGEQPCTHPETKTRQPRVSGWGDGATQLLAMDLRSSSAETYPGPADEHRYCRSSLRGAGQDHCMYIG